MSGLPNQSSPSDLEEISRGLVEIVEGRQASEHYAFNDLLRVRLTAFSLIAVIVMSVLLIWNLIHRGIPLFAFRENLLIAMVACFIFLRRRAAISTRVLRLVEALVFGLIAVQISVMYSLYLWQFAGQNDDVSTSVVSILVYLWWSLLIMIYGVAIPNTWRRAALILLPAALVPALLIGILRWQNEKIDAIIEANRFQFYLYGWPVGVALTAIYISSVSHSIRREVFKAKQFGQYHLKEKLTSGGMGDVYRAEHQLLKRPCALKLIRRENDTDTVAIIRFEREVQTTARLTHWNTVEIFDYGHTDDGTFYYVMELLNGMNLAELVRNYGPLLPARVIHFLRQVCSALREAHGIGFIHRDLKPSNIFAAIQGGVYDVAKLLDFGLVKLTQDDSQGDLTLSRVGEFGGSPLYMAPEQASAFKDADARCDIYGLGAVSYFLLTGKPPFSKKSVMEIIYAHESEPVVPPSHLNSAIPDDLEQVVLRCLEKKPENRFQTAGALRSALASCNGANGWSEEKAAEWWRQSVGLLE